MQHLIGKAVAVVLGAVCVVFASEMELWRDAGFSRIQAREWPDMTRYDAKWTRDAPKQLLTVRK